MAKKGKAIQFHQLQEGLLRNREGVHLTLRGGLRGNSVRVCPMLNVKYDDLKFALQVFDQVLSEV